MPSRSRRSPSASRPLAIPALLGYRGRSESFLELLLRVWAPVAIVIYIFSATGLSATPLHAFDGITVPLAVLAVKGVTRTSVLRTMPRARLVVGGGDRARRHPGQRLRAGHRARVRRPGRRQRQLHHPRRARGAALPGQEPRPGRACSRSSTSARRCPGATGRRTFVGNCLWSEPNCMPRSAAADALFRGQDTRDAGAAAGAQSGARFLLASCAPHADLRAARWARSSRRPPASAAPPSTSWTAR